MFITISILIIYFDTFSSNSMLARSSRRKQSDITVFPREELVGDAAASYRDLYMRFRLSKASLYSCVSIKMCTRQCYNSEARCEDDAPRGIDIFREGKSRQAAISVAASNRVDKQKRLLWRTRLLLRIMGRYSHGRHV